MKTATLENEKTGLRGTETQARTRLLLALWDMGGADVKKGELMARVVARPKEKTSSYQPILSQLEKEQAIAISGKSPQIISLSDEGLQLLDKELKNAEFSFDASIGAKTANALLKWVRASNSAVRIAETDGNGSNGKVKAAVQSYDEFKSVALEVYDRLNRDYNMGNLVPIYRIRREIGEGVTRSQFSEWLFEMQSNDLLQLLEESVEDSAPDKIEDSVTTKLGKLRCYAKRLAS